MMTPVIVFAEGGPEESVTIETELLTALRNSLQQSTNSSFVLTVKESDGNLVAGLTAGCSYGWLLIKTLWVAESYRRQGLARKLMAQAEEKAVGLHCHGVWLDTSSPGAMRFYEGIGYEIFGELRNEEDQLPPSHRRWFMKKRL
ncbi:GNAT family N-acetyltransferase [Pelagibius sp. Alg239-R121]|uniref:GNAT family N-acetyltransferase n=1 Tax=Pelagibius sp. Alg239-R121 TaxID=2993448 RepID=UPI0024A6E877|nr:GNAT family N-acetyltransferase [Pelagibius sp. Alg239-R121]